MNPGCCFYCGTTDPSKHWWSCPVSPEMIAVKPKAIRITEQIMRRRRVHLARAMRVLPVRTVDPAHVLAAHQAIELSFDNISLAARNLGISRSTLRRRLEKPKPQPKTPKLGPLTIKRRA